MERSMGSTAVALNTTSGNPAGCAVTLLGPGVGPSVSRVQAMPAASVVDAAGSTDPPPEVTSHSTSIPAMPLPCASATFTTSGCSSCKPAGADCPSPDVGDAFTGGPGAAAAVNTVKVDGLTEAVRYCSPARVPSVQTACVRPFASVVPLLGLTLPPPSWTDQLTFVPAIALPYASTTSTTSGAASGSPTVAACPSPEIRLTEVGGPGSARAENTTGSSPGTVAVAVCGPAVVPSVQVARAMPSSP